MEENDSRGDCVEVGCQKAQVQHRRGGHFQQVREASIENRLGDGQSHQENADLPYPPFDAH